jgi:murein DD-endopeptidase MepM/ murein hydrolase activator NlpD
MRTWPLNQKSPKKTHIQKQIPNNYRVPQKGEAGSFWENRGDRYHCGVDIYAPENTEVLSIEDGIVVETGLMTSPYVLPYWNSTYYIIIEHRNGLFCKYGELAGLTLREGDRTESGQLIGYVGTVLNSEKIDESCPPYIQKLKNENPSMLHFELWKDHPIPTDKNYLGGNWFSNEKPENLLDPTKFLESLCPD